MLSKKEKAQLNIYSCEIRKATLKAICEAGGGHAGGAMSMVEALAVLYGKAMNVDPADPKKKDRDRFVLSKGHCGPSLYAALALKGFFPMDVLWTMNKGGTMLPSHVDRKKTPGIDFSTGSLGQGISMAVGSALGAAKTDQDYYTYCMLGDGECDEGQVWEALLFANQQKLDHLIVFVDYNKKQLDGPLESVCSLGNIGEKFKAFGWDVQKVAGDNVEAIYDAIQEAKKIQGKPSIIILDTIKGHGCKYAEGLTNCHHIVISQEVYEKEAARLDEEIAEYRKEEA